MPMDKKLYPKDWKQIAHGIKEQANWCCQECGRPCRLPSESNGELIERIETEHPHWASDLYDRPASSEGANGVIAARYKLTRFTLTVAHPNHDPENHDAELKAWCSVCHCRYDLKAMPLKKRLKAERLGQLFLTLEGEN